MKQKGIIPLDIGDSRDQIKLCHAFTESKNYFHQELDVINPCPTQYDPEYIFPRDMLLYSFHIEHDSNLLPIDELVKIVEQAKAPIHCVGSHRPDTDHSIQLAWIPASDTMQSQLILQLSPDISSQEKKSIVENLCHIGNLTSE